MQETRVILHNAGKLEHPTNAKEYAALGGYEGLKKAIGMGQTAIIDVVKASGLRGRGGAGFPTGLKWSFMQPSNDPEKYIICNADEGEPGTNKDRVIFEVDPHCVLEGMAIAGVATGATKGIIYLRIEYPECHKILAEAIDSARKNGFLGNNIMGTGASFDIEIYTGAGAYVCGEESALMESIEGKRGEPRFKPPFPAAKGVFGKPTTINNVETLAVVPQIIINGAEWFRKYGTEKCPGTKLFTLCGNVKNPGVYEFPIGVTIRQLFEEVGGGCANGKALKGVQTGGASGNIINANQIDVAMDIESCAAAGATFGAGDLMFFDENQDVIDIVENLMEFFVHESCGKCTPCREGNMRLLQLVRKFKNGTATEKDLETIDDLASTMMCASLCGLGQASPSPLVSSIKNFKNNFSKAIERGQN